MGNLKRRGILAGVLMLTGSYAFAQPAGPGPGSPSTGGSGTGGSPGMGGPGPMGGGRGGPGLGRMSDPAGYLAGLKAQLEITESQTPAWDAYAGTVAGIAGQMQGIRQTMWEAMPTATWQERRDTMNTMFGVRQQASDTVRDAAMKLLPSLTAEQRKKAAVVLPGVMTPPQQMGAGMGRGQMMGRQPQPN